MEDCTAGPGRVAARCCGAGSGRARRLRPGSGDADGEAAWTAPAGLVKHELTASNEQINRTFAVNTRDNFLPLIPPRVALPAKWGCAPSADGRLGGGHPGRGHRGERPASWLFTAEERLPHPVPVRGPVQPLPDRGLVWPGDRPRISLGPGFLRHKMRLSPGAPSGP